MIRCKFQYPIFVLSGLVAFLISGCINLDPKPDPTRYYTIAPPLGDSPANSGIVWLEWRIVEFPESAESDVIFLSSGDFSASKRSYQRWGEPLEKAFIRTLEFGIRKQSPATVLRGFIGSSSSDNSLLSLHVKRIEAHEAGDAVLEVVYEIGSNSLEGDSLTQRFYMEAQWTPEDFETLAAAYSDLIQQLGEEIGRILNSDT